MILPNPTHYIGDYTRTHIDVPDTYSFTFESNKRLSYYQRLYFEFLYTKKLGGQTFFYTLTYNNSSIPKFLGHNCFDYKDIRYITNGALSKTLQRKYGARLRYFCACESGEGAGTRGIGNNPHYHFIFFVQPFHRSGVPDLEHFRNISAVDFRSEIKRLWQGFDEFRDGFRDFRTAKYGIAREGLNQGEVFSPDAFKYVSKYVIKDSYFKNLDSVVYNHYASVYQNSSFNYKFLSFYYYCTAIKQYSRSSFLDSIDFDHFLKHRHEDRTCTLEKWLKLYSSDILEDFKVFNNVVGLPVFVKHYLREFQNHHSSKPRCSKSLGIYGLSYVRDVESNPLVLISDSNGSRTYKPCLFYLRKLYYDVRICPHSGNPLYVLNDTGRNYLYNSLGSRISKFISSVRESLCSYTSISKEPLDCYLLSDFVLFRYSLFKLVYSYRSYRDSPDDLTDRYKYDYSVFLSVDTFNLDYETQSITRVRRFGLRSYNTHPYFIKYIRYFEQIDEICGLVNGFVSDSRKADFDSKSKTLRNINSVRVNSIYE